MTGEECVEWVTERYGSPFIQHANGVFVAVVPLLNAKVAIGCGSCVTNAVCDLYCELVSPSRRNSFTDGTFAIWEGQRRIRRDKAAWSSVDVEG